MELQSVNYKNDELKVDINCYTDNEKEIWFRGKEIAVILGHKNPERAVRKFVDDDDKKLIDFKIKCENSRVTKTVPLEKTYKCFFINESGFYSLIFSSKIPTAKEFKRWVTSKVLPSIRKKGYYSNLMFKSEYDLHCKVVDFIRNKYEEALMIAGLGENQKNKITRIKSWKKGYMAGQCDLMIMNPTSKYNSLCIELKNPTDNNVKLSEKQQEMKELYEKYKCKYIVSNNYDDILFEITNHMVESKRYISYRSKRNVKNN